MPKQKLFPCLDGRKKNQSHGIARAKVKSMPETLQTSNFTPGPQLQKWHCTAPETGTNRTGQRSRNKST